MEDIIDPDLGPYRMDNGNYITRKLAEIEELKKKGVELSRDQRYFVRDVKLGDYDKISEGVQV